MPSLMASVHIAQVILVLSVLGVAVVNRFVIENPPPGRAGIMVFGIAGKSLIIIAYQVLSKKYHKWFSLRANIILNCLEVIFWAAVVFMSIQANMQFCNGIHCTLNWIMSFLGGITATVTGFATIISIRLFRAAKAAKRGYINHKGGYEMSV
ncbi:hypothetical protein ONS95_007262 [Cadophora gregata]|uniref:uncharacterized protein n=1 Tax=Cadophora gregata TaxID=51156 RepID=UPI0026DB4C0E|nr:uncharacterized protein ONS95_007262 [Cadophora gregata]KAK0100814.1 hypothetical protein ONS95_007262 [Cadophora gregata]